MCLFEILISCFKPNETSNMPVASSAAKTNVSALATKYSTASASENNMVVACRSPCPGGLVPGDTRYLSSLMYGSTHSKATVKDQVPPNVTGDKNTEKTPNSEATRIPGAGATALLHDETDIDRTLPAEEITSQMEVSELECSTSVEHQPDSNISKNLARSSKHSTCSNFGSSDAESVSSRKRVSALASRFSSGQTVSSDSGASSCSAGHPPQFVPGSLVRNISMASSIDSFAGSVQSTDNIFIKPLITIVSVRTEPIPEKETDTDEAELAETEETRTLSLSNSSLLSSVDAVQVPPSNDTFNSDTAKLTKGSDVDEEAGTFSTEVATFNEDCDIAPKPDIAGVPEDSKLREDATTAVVEASGTEFISDRSSGIACRGNESAQAQPGESDHRPKDSIPKQPTSNENEGGGQSDPAEDDLFCPEPCFSSDFCVQSIITGFAEKSPGTPEEERTRLDPVHHNDGTVAPPEVVHVAEPIISNDQPRNLSTQTSGKGQDNSIPDTGPLTTVAPDSTSVTLLQSAPANSTNDTTTPKDIDDTIWLQVRKDDLIRVPTSDGKTVYLVMACLQEKR